MKKSGFTLVEILLAVGVVGVISTLVLQVLVASLRSNTKTEIVKEIKQNGDFSLETMGRMIQQARQITSACTAAGSTTDALELVGDDDMTTTFNCQLDGSTTRIASTSAIGTRYLTSTAINCSGLSFTCTQDVGVPARVKISFTLAKQAAPGESYQETESDFTTTVLMRNTQY